jgi:membrane protein DedA with SNARE-associated domain
VDPRRVINSGRRHASLAALAGAAAITAVLLVYAILEGDLGSEGFGGLGGLVGEITSRFGASASIALLYIEESGLPLPVPGDVYVAYLGSLAQDSAIEFVTAWLAIVLAVTAGATNLYLVAQRWGHRLVTHRLAPVLHLDEERLRRVELWFNRWGALAVILGRHIPGCRIPITVVAGIFHLQYRVFAPSVAVSTAVWAGIWLWLGAQYGPSVVHVLGRHTWMYAVVLAVIAVAVGLIAVRAWRASTAPK